LRRKAHELQTPLGAEQLRRKVAHTEPLHVPMHAVQRTDIHISEGAKGMNSEDEEFNRIEREADMRRKAVSAALNEHAMHMRANLSEYERGVIDGRQMQVQSSVDKAVNAMALRKWRELEPSDMPDGDDPIYDHPYFIKGMVYANIVLKEKNA
jgi:hypothetical protein